MDRQSCLYAFLLILSFQSTIIKGNNVLSPPHCRPVTASTLAKIEFSLNLLIYKTELFLRASVGLGINDISPGLVRGPVPIGATVANLDDATRKVIEELGLAGVGHLRAVVNTGLLKAPIPMPLLDLGPQTYARYLNQIFNVSTLHPPFNTYANTKSFLFAAFYASYFLQQYFAGIIPFIVGNAQKQLVAGIELNEASGYGVLRAQLNARVNSTVPPYTFTVGNLTNQTAQLGSQLGGCGVKDEGLVVPLQLGAENQTTSNVIPADVNSLIYPRFEREVLRVLFTTGNATRPGGIFPGGFNGTLFQRMVLLRLS